jgi:hypothetical protein
MVFNCPFHLKRVILQPAKQFAIPFPAALSLFPALSLTFPMKTPKIVPGFPPTPIREAGDTLVCESKK